jgi:glycosyltransferase involved in cell wall biosynthesis
VVSISDAQRAPLPQANWIGTVHHGLPRNLYAYHPRGGDYLAFVGRISPEKRVDRAVEIALRSGRPLRIAAKIDAADHAYFRDSIRPLLEHSEVEYVGELADREKDAFVGGAAALLFPIDWPEPFGLAMIEALACGTPVIAWRHGAVPEVVDHGVTGFVCEDVAAAVRAVHALHRIDRSACRRAFEARFTSEHMAHAYLGLYGLVASGAARGRLAS